MPRVTISEPRKTPQPYRFQIDPKVIHIGRGADNDIIIDCTSCSTNHCTMEHVEGGYILRDTGSTNGIKLNGTLMEVVDLVNGMEVLVGDVPLHFELTDDELETLNEQEFISLEKKKLPVAHEVEEPEALETSNTSSQFDSLSEGRTRNQGGLGAGLFKAFIVLFLLLIAICVGMSLRHFKRTGHFLPTQIINGGDQNKVEKNDPPPAATPDPSAESQPESQ